MNMMKITEQEFINLSIRERDGLVAKYIAGWCFDHAGANVDEFGVFHMRKSSYYDGVPKYTTDLNHAFNLLNMIKNYGAFVTRQVRPVSWRCEINGPMKTATVNESAALAICISALKHKGVIVE